MKNISQKIYWSWETKSLFCFGCFLLVYRGNNSSVSKNQVMEYCQCHYGTVEIPYARRSSSVWDQCVWEGCSYSAPPLFFFFRKGTPCSVKHDCRKWKWHLKERHFLFFRKRNPSLEVKHLSLPLAISKTCNWNDSIIAVKKKICFH